MAATVLALVRRVENRPAARKRFYVVCEQRAPTPVVVARALGVSLASQQLRSVSQRTVPTQPHPTPHACPYTAVQNVWGRLASASRKELESSSSLASSGAQEDCYASSPASRGSLGCVLTLALAGHGFALYTVLTAASLPLAPRSCPVCAGAVRI